MKATASISLVIASILAASALVMPAASAAPANFELSTSTALSAGSSLYSPEEVDALAQELEKIFTDYVTAGEDGIYRVDEAAVKADGKLGDIEGYRGFAMMMNSDLAETRSPNRATSPSHGVIGVMGVEEFTRCTIGNAIGVGILNTPGLIKGAVAAVKAWNWGLAAKTILRIAGPIALKGAGGLPGLAAQLAVAAWSCRDKL